MGSSEVNAMTSQKRNLRKESGKGNKSTKEKVKGNDRGTVKFSVRVRLVLLRRSGMFTRGIMY